MGQSLSIFLGLFLRRSRRERGWERVSKMGNKSQRGSLKWEKPWPTGPFSSLHHDKCSEHTHAREAPRSLQKDDLSKTLLTTLYYVLVPKAFQELYSSIMYKYETFYCTNKTIISYRKKPSHTVIPLNLTVKWVKTYKHNGCVKVI